MSNATQLERVREETSQDLVRGLCGGCQQWGSDPVIKNGQCTVCDRTEAQITEAHGQVRLSLKQKQDIAIDRMKAW